jgi:hypothetical protein
MSQRSQWRSSSGADIRHPTEGISRYRGVVRGDVVDLTARNTNIHKLAVRQAAQFGLQPPAFAPLLKCPPI